MVVRCAKDSLNIFTQSEVSAEIAAKFNCSPLQASLLEMRGLTADVMPCEVENWLSPHLPLLLEKLDLGADNGKAVSLVRGLSPSSDVVVYGDYDVDGISSTAIAMELALSRGAHVRYFIPHRFNQGYGLHNDVAATIAKRKCDLVIVVDCGSQDAEAVETLKKSGIPVIIFDHHLVEGKRAESDTMINPQLAGDAEARKLCATGVIWSWIWQNELLSRDELLRLLDVVALATVADCVSLASSLNRALVREGLKSIRSNARPGLNILMEQLGISPSSIDTEDLAMKIIPCLNAAGRLYLADLAVDILFPGSQLASNVGKLIALNRRRRELSTKILDQVEKLKDDKFKYVLTRDDWSVGVLSSVASRICSERNAPVALVAPVGGIMRGTLRMPAGGDAVGVLKQLAPLLNTWGGHRLAAGFSVKLENWETLRGKMEEMLSGVVVKGEKEDLLYWNPVNLDMEIWSGAAALGPFGMENPAPMLYAPYNGRMNLSPLGKTGKHVKVDIGSASLLAFGAADMFEERSGLEGWVYKPRLDTWRNVTSLQFVLEKMVMRDS
ncbi:MAG: DHH family phosphoesterase [Synergistaceae bacterium]|nr:DHH family phosphoesterase [Synergistaceae bacterium]